MSMIEDYHDAQTSHRLLAYWIGGVYVFDANVCGDCLERLYSDYIPCLALRLMIFHLI